jgi:very-short-patch-repair endonuclease
MTGSDNAAKTDRARRLRREQTDPERRFWYKVRNRQLGGYKFVRQEPIGPYFADFACREARLVSQHAESERDQVRDAFLRGYRVLRFWNPGVLRSIDSVRDTIFAALGPRSSSPRLRGEVESARSAEPGEGFSTPALDSAAAPHPLGFAESRPARRGAGPRSGRTPSAASRSEAR